jgi:valyl-tRNA synthetase
MEIAKTYNPKEVEDRWYQHWMEQGFFRSVPDEREPFTIVIPPPNVTGVLHMGHMLNNTIQDILIRRARMMGFNACWVPGTDHASIATEAKVVNLLREQSIKKSDIGRDAFMMHAYEWKDKYGGIILEQLKKLGASCDWERTRFTMEPKLYAAVVKVFVDLYNKGYIYRDLKMVNWDPRAQTTLSNEEVIYKENKQAKLYYIKYVIEGTEDFITIATTRPETLLGDTAVCVHPEDERYTVLHNRKVIVPLVNRHVPVIVDEYVDREFGTGALKVTPAHDINDYELGKKHGIETIDIMNPDGTISEAGELYIGQDRFAVRKQIVADLEAAGLLIKTEEIVNKVGYSERNPDTVVEPRLSLQWFVDMQELVKPALENVMNDNIHFHPDSFKNLYKHWMENIRNWPISRQLWWGQRIPAYYLSDGRFVVAETVEEAIELAKEQFGLTKVTAEDLRQDEDVLDTWFSSWLWPISVFDGFEGPEEVDYYYPTNVLVTGWDIIFFWVARMVIAGYEYKGEKPFNDVYFTGMVRDKQGRKMSKSLGNSPDPLSLIDQYGADGMRVGILISAPSGNDVLFDDKLCEQGRNFVNKLWNAFRLIQGWEVTPGKNEENEASILWMRQRLNMAIVQIDQSFEQYRLSEALLTVYNLVWDEFCSWYLEMIKPEYQHPIDAYTLEQTTLILEDLLRLLHPFTPFISEHIWQQIREREAKDSLIVAQWPKAGEVDETLLSNFELVKEMISGVRDIRNQQQVKPKDTVDLFGQVANTELYELYRPQITKLAKLGMFEYTEKDIDNAQAFMAGSDRFFVSTGVEVNPEEERAKMLQELEYTKGFIRSVEGKLSNERFVSSAPTVVVDAERKKLADGQAKVKALEESLAKLG